MNPIRALGAIMIIALVFSAPAVLLAEEDEGAPSYTVMFNPVDGSTGVVKYATEANHYRVSAPDKWVGCWTYTNERHYENGVLIIDPADVWKPTDTITKDTQLIAAYPPFEYRSPEKEGDGPDYLLWGLGALVAVLGIAVGLVWFRH